MKRSNGFLLIALTLPAIISIAGISAGMQKLKPVEGASGDFGNMIESMSGDMQIIHEALVPVANELKLTANAAQVEVRFDSSLQGKARVKVESATPELAVISIGERQMSFAPTDKGQTLRVTLSLPTNLDKLSADFNAVRCDVQADTPVKILDMSLSVQASKCDLEWRTLTTQKFKAEINAGNLDFRAETWFGGDFIWEINAANLDLRLGRLKFADDGKRNFSVSSSTGNGEIHIERSTTAELNANLTMGKLEVDLVGQRLELSGLNQKHRIDAKQGAPSFDLEVNMGKLEFKVGQFLD